MRASVRRSRWARTTTLLAALAVTAACSSNAGSGDEGFDLDGDGSAVGTTGGATTGAATTTGSPGGKGTKGNGAAQPGQAGSTGTGGTGGTTGAATGAASGTTGGTTGVPRKVTGPLGPGITATTIKLGLNWSSDGAAVASAVSGQQYDLESDFRKPYTAVINYINTHGGIAGRKVVPVWYDAKLGSGKTEPQRQGERCATFTEDNKTFAAWPGNTTSDSEASCYSKRGTLLVYSSNGTLFFDDESYKRYPNLWSINVPSADRAYRTTVDRLYAAGYFDKGAKIGIVYANDPGSARAVNRSMKPALARYGLKAALVSEITSSKDPGTMAQAEQEMQASVLRFNNNGITHVVFGNGLWQWMAGSWIKHAQNQRYFPRYGFNSTTGGNTVDYTGADISASMNRAVLIGWNPQYDVGDYSPTLRAKLCNQIVAKAGFNTTDQQIAQQPCQFMFFIKDGLDAAQELNSKGFAAGLARLGTVPAVATFATRYAGRRDGPAFIQNGGYFASCDCWRYVGSRRPF